LSAPPGEVRPQRHEPTPARGPFPRAQLAQPTLEAARALIGAHLVRDDSAGVRIGRIVEVEAYIGEHDRASHARFGRTARNRVMYGPPGMAYVYLVYGMYDCLNVVTEPEGRPAAVLVRAVEPIEGIGAMRAARVRHASQRARAADDLERARRRVDDLPSARLAAGPGLVAAAFGITREDTGSDLLAPNGPLRLTMGEPPPEVVTTTRIGIGYAAEPWRSKPWRFVDPASPALSR
jgi:DNA-3-methyladenine glycosylase